MSRFAAVDCGTNSIRLLISEVDQFGVATDLAREMRIVRLGEGVDATGELDPAAIERARVALAEYVAMMEAAMVEDVVMVATSATRDASNKEDFFSMTASLLGRIVPGRRAEVITGEQEAALSFKGAIADLPPEAGPFCVIDLGGGSTEFIVGDSEGEISGAHSAQMGCVRLTERIMRTDPPTDTEVEIAEDYVAKQLAHVEAIVPLAEANTFIGCAGTFTTLSALAQGLEEYNAEEIHGSSLRFDALRALTAQIIGESSQQRAANPVVHPGRADVLAGGCVVVRGIMDLIEKTTGQCNILISEKDILDGLIADISSNR